MTNKTRDCNLTIIVPDIHAPFQDDVAVNLVRDFIKENRPNQIVFLGDLFDFAQISVFRKSPSIIPMLQEDIDVGTRIAKDMVSGLTKHRVFHCGNHESRWSKFLIGEAPALTSLRSLKFEKMTGLSDLDFTIHEEGALHHVGGGLHTTHGHRVSKHAGRTAQMHLESYGVSVAVGHCHRLGDYRISNFGGYREAFECGHLANPNPEYVVGRPNWQQGFALAWYTDDDFWVDLVPIKNGQFWYAGKCYK